MVSGGVPDMHVHQPEEDLPADPLPATAVRTPAEDCRLLLLLLRQLLSASVQPHSHLASRVRARPTTVERTLTKLTEKKKLQSFRGGCDSVRDRTRAQNKKRRGLLWQQQQQQQCCFVLLNFFYVRVRFDLRLRDPRMIKCPR